MSNSVLNLIGNGKTKQAIQYLIENLNGSDRNDALLLSSRLNALENEQRQGLISYSDAAMNLARINQSAIHYADRLPKNGDATTIIVAPQAQVVNVNMWFIGGTNYQDPTSFEQFLVKTRMGVMAEFNEAIAFGTSVLAYMKPKFNERVFSKHFIGLKYALEDLIERKNMENLKIVISEIAEKKDLVIEFLLDEVEISDIETLYQTAKSNETTSFVTDYESFLKIWLQNNRPDDKLILNQWQAARKDFEIRIAGKSSLFTDGKLNELRNQWINRFNP